MENDSGVQEVSSSLTMTGNILEDEVEKNQKMNLRNSLDRLTIDTLKVVCRGKGLFEKGNKKELVERLVDRAKGKDRVVDSIKNKNVEEERMGFDIEEGVHNNIARNRFLNNVNEDGTGFEGVRRVIWILINNSAILSNDWNIILKAREIVATRAFVLRIVNYEEWNIATKIEDKFLDDFIKVLFHNKLTNAKQSVKNKQQRVKNKSASSGSAFNSIPIGVTVFAPN
ncbi:24818_t:CDS:2 [Cetraspora pellucida]|uniref:24818_t:CDS:1 n=1 Tax=Cetraspora pellucida TaxID=1433469 RepID=A0A9N9GT03_9GLOM|nr:24818_t:CDS:2 [Cetraspora pellucida]